MLSHRHLIRVSLLAPKRNIYKAFIYKMYHIIYKVITECFITNAKAYFQQDALQF